MSSSRSYGRGPIIDEIFNDIGTKSTGTVTIDYNNGSYQKLTVGGDISIAFSNLPVSGKAWGITLELVNGAAHTITWPAALKTPAGDTLEQTAAGTDILVFTGHTGSDTIYGMTAAEDIQ